MFCIITDKVVQTLEDFCADIVLAVMNNAVDECVEVEIMFLKGHVSPPQSPGEDIDEPRCLTQCELKTYLFDKIGQIDTCENETERIADYLHAYEDLMSAIKEIEVRLDAILFDKESSLFRIVCHDN